MGDAASGTLAHLKNARDACLQNPPHYLQLAPAILNNVAGASDLELRRWTADFFAEMFSSPMLAPEHKEHLGLMALDLLKGYLEMPKQDTAILKSTVQAITCIYPFIYKHVNPKDKDIWEKMAVIKRFISTKMDELPVGVNICCIKFVQRVVQLQTDGLITDPRRPDQNDLSLSLVPSDHPLLDKQRLGAEATGLLDRLLDYLLPPSEAILFTSTLNSLGVLVRTRPALSDRIANAIKRINPFSLKTQGITPRVKVLTKSMERTLRAFLINWSKRVQNTPESSWIQSYLLWLEQSRREFQDESRKRPAPTDTPDISSEAVKRPRIAATGTPPVRPDQPSMPVLPVSLAGLFTLTQEPTITNAREVHPHILVGFLEPLIRLINPNQYGKAVNDVRARYLAIQEAVRASTAPAPPIPPGNQAPLPPRVPSSTVAPPKATAVQPVQDVAIGPYIVPQPGPMTQDDVEECMFPPPMFSHSSSLHNHAASRATRDRIFGSIKSAPATSDAPDAPGGKPGFYRLAASTHGRKSLMTLSIRMATRLAAGDDHHRTVKPEPNGLTTNHSSFFAPDLIREALRIYVLQDFRANIDTAISWLTEEWYADKLHTGTSHTYQKWALKILEGIAPYVAPKDKQIIVLLSEIPEVTPKMLEWVQKLARDPERAALAVRVLQYLVLTRVPVRGMCLDAMQELYGADERLRGLCEKTLKSHRPEFLETVQMQEQMKQDGDQAPPVPMAT
ncbi:MAG: hypothetical protein M1831_002836 [Alyxoria varia]|nr:MAG: hypothetical protein M1831_002836 [Alyxoria varia]